MASRGFGDGGEVDLSAQESINVAFIATAAPDISGSVTAISFDGNVDLENINTGIGISAGTIDVLAPLGNIFINGVLSTSEEGEEEEGVFDPFDDFFDELDEDNDFFNEDAFFDDSSDFEDFAADNDILDLEDFDEGFDEEFDGLNELDELEEDLSELNELENELEDLENELEELENELEELENELEELENELEELEEDINEDLEDLEAFNAWELNVLDAAEAGEELSRIEQNSRNDFSSYFGRSLGSKEPTPAEVRQLLIEVQERTGNRSAIVYIQTPLVSPNEDNSLKESEGNHKSDRHNSDRAKQTQPNSVEKQASEDSLEILLFTADQSPIKISISSVDTEQLAQTVQQFRSTLALSARRNNNSYLEPSQQLYTTLITPIEEALAEKDIDTLVFSMSAGLRTLPVAALHDGEQFLVEKYSLSVVPSLSLIDTRQSSLGEAQVLAMGVSEFDTLAPLPAVPVEVDIINQLWPGAALLNERSTRNNLIEQRQQSLYKVIHLATHADFKPGKIENSYIQLWDEQIRLSELHQLGWEYPAVDLLVLSACSTAVGSPEAEMGFAGLAIASGVRSAMASLWPVSDVGTLGLMSEFYGQLKTRSVKVEALRSAQLAMLQGTIQSQDGELLTSHASFPLPTDSERFSNVDLSHPYYWAGFTMIGSPW
ncbi:MAG: CHAT domain-containing protein [Phormidesmis sp.]